ncbi:MAG: oxidoreductase-like domain-containing protein [Gammaproteobacteria bacterium]
MKKPTEFGELPPNLPPRPVEPVPGECCGGNCENCVWIFYERALKRWEERCGELLAGQKK